MRAAYEELVGVAASEDPLEPLSVLAVAGGVVVPFVNE